MRKGAIAAFDLDSCLRFGKSVHVCDASQLEREALMEHEVVLWTPFVERDVWRDFGGSLTKWSIDPPLMRSLVAVPVEARIALENDLHACSAVP